jgi:hypothetical protein
MGKPQHVTHGSRPIGRLPAGVAAAPERRFGAGTAPREAVYSVGSRERVDTGRQHPAEDPLDEPAVGQLPAVQTRPRRIIPLLWAAMLAAAALLHATEVDRRARIREPSLPVHDARSEALRALRPAWREITGVAARQAAAVENKQTESPQTEIGPQPQPTTTQAALGVEQAGKAAAETSGAARLEADPAPQAAGEKRPPDDTATSAGEQKAEIAVVDEPARHVDDVATAATAPTQAATKELSKEAAPRAQARRGEAHPTAGPVSAPPQSIRPHPARAARHRAVAIQKVSEAALYLDGLGARYFTVERVWCNSP